MDEEEIKGLRDRFYKASLELLDLIKVFGKLELEMKKQKIIEKKE